MQTLTKSATQVPSYPCMFTVLETAWAAETDNQFINGEVDRKIVKVQCDGKRLLAHCDLLYFRTVRLIGPAINIELRRIIYTELRSALEHGNSRKVSYGYFTLNIKQVLNEIDERTAEIDAAKRSVESSPGIRGGEIVIKGTRIPVRTISRIVQSGSDYAEVASEYDLNERQIRLAVLYDKLYPKRGRPSVPSPDGEWMNVGAPYRKGVESIGEYKKS